MARRTKDPIYVVPDPARVAFYDGRPLHVIASYTSYPKTDRPVKVSGVKEGECDRRVILSLTKDEGRKLALDILSFLGDDLNA